ncbi:MAG: hypothetical protein WCL18_10045 [bacterium]
MKHFKNNPDTNHEPKTTRSNTWKNRRRKLNTYGYRALILTTLLVTACGPKESEVTVTAKQHDADVENVTAKKENLENKKTAHIKAEKEEKDAEKELLDAEKQEKESKRKTKQDANNL